MPKANFYLMKQDSEHARSQLACRLAEQVSRQGQRVYIRAANTEAARELDALLWSFTPESFVPHALKDSPEAAHAPVLIGSDSSAPTGTHCYLNLGTDAAPEQAGVEVVAEFVLNDPTAKATSRASWATYKQRGWELQHHQL